jgi:glycosyltransferase involved in cell wall biosynthesis
MTHSSNVYPAIPPVSPLTPRPMWSVMIPTYNCAAYLAHTLRSVVEQAPSPDDMQIEVVDDASAADDPEAVVQQIGGDRIAFFRQPKNVGPQANFTACVQRSRGHWVHILHGDDMVRPGFYAALHNATRREPGIHAAFCRVINIDEDNEWIDLSDRERDTAGVMSDLVQRLAVWNHIMFPSIVVRRDAYEQLGGFHPLLFHSADWDMWKRIASRYPVWYEPHPFALYRIHRRSDTSRLMQTGANIADARRAIDIAAGYLPPAESRALTRQARRHHGLYAIEVAHECIQRGDWRAARAQVAAGLRCCPSPSVWAATIGLVLQTLLKRRPFSPGDANG